MYYLPCNVFSNQVSLNLLNATYFYNYLTRGGAQSSSPLKSTKNQGLRVKHGRTLKYRQLLGSRKKLGSIPPKLGPYRGNTNQNVGLQYNDYLPFLDSRIVQDMVKKESYLLNTFAGLRVKEIATKSDVLSWMHIRSKILLLLIF